MSTTRGWDAWSFDTPTTLWVLWIAFFVVLESWALTSGQPEHTLTWHLRPFFYAHPLAWFLAAGAGAWGYVHFVLPGLERRLLDAVL